MSIYNQLYRHYTILPCNKPMQTNKLASLTDSCPAKQKRQSDRVKHLVFLALLSRLWLRTKWRCPHAPRTSLLSLRPCHHAPVVCVGPARWWVAVMPTKVHAIPAIGVLTTSAVNILRRTWRGTEWCRNM